MPIQLPQLSLSPKNAAAEQQLTAVSVQSEVLQRILKGESALSVAQDLLLSEKEVNELLTAGLTIAARLMQEHATELQTKLYLQHEGLYMMALANINGTEIVEEDDEWEDKDGKTVRGKKKVERPVQNINWFDRASKELAAMQSLVLPFLKEAKPPAPTIHLTVERDSDIYKRFVDHLADADPFSE